MAEPTIDQPQRIAKAMARAGLCSRRDAERWIAAGRVSVDGAVLTSPAVTVTADSQIRVDGKPLPDPERARLWRYHKPAGLVTTHRDERDRPTVFAALPADLPRLVSIGRLDLNSEGLLLLTNDGDLANRIAHPSHGVDKEYLAEVTPARVSPGALRQLRDGVHLDDGITAPAKVSHPEPGLVRITIHEGKNRQVRRMFEAVGHNVTRLVRTRIGPLSDRTLAPGAWRELEAAERRSLIEAVAGDPPQYDSPT